MSGWEPVVVLVSSLATVLALFVGLMQYYESFKTKTSLWAAVIFGFVMIALIAVAIANPKKVLSIMEAQPPDPSPTVRLPAAVHDHLNPVSVSVPSTSAWTPTGIFVNQGQVVTIRAKGEIIVSDHDPPMGPDGTGKACYPNPGIHYWHFPAQYLSCASLIGRIGDLPPFEVGSVKQFRAPASGSLILGVNDNWFNDNRGDWDATVVVGSNNSQ